MAADVTGVLPAMPEATGLNPSKVRFYSEVATAFEFLALFYSLGVKEQEEMCSMMRGFATASVTEAHKRSKQK